MQSEEQASDLLYARRIGRKVRTSWTTWIVDGALLLATIVGAHYAWPAQAEAGRVHGKRVALQRLVGEMPIKDPTKYHVLLLDSESPLEFRWRVYVPAKTDLVLSTEARSSNGSSSSTSNFSGSSDPALEGLVTATILSSKDNPVMNIKIHARSLHSRGSTGMQLSDENIQQMVDNNNTTSWQIAGKDGVQMFSVDEMVCLLAIASPKKVADATPAGMLRIRLGTQAVIEKARSQ